MSQGGKPTPSSGGGTGSSDYRKFFHPSLLLSARRARTRDICLDLIGKYVVTIAGHIIFLSKRKNTEFDSIGSRNYARRQFDRVQDA